LKVLITAATSASAHKLKNLLNNPDTILGDYADLPAFMLKSQGMIKLPNPLFESYAHLMLTLCLDHGFETVYILNKPEWEGLLPSKQLFNEYNIDILNGEAYL
jgi:hypothetical protein